MTFGGNGVESGKGWVRWPEDADDLVKRSFDAGVTFFDGDVYAGGLSETIFGHSLRNLHLPRDGSWSRPRSSAA
jgi:aryl-alcohol dehydrogenase-like predicted oxidoreductase